MTQTSQVKERVPPRGGIRRSPATRYPAEFKFKAVKLVLDYQSPVEFEDQFN